jgi:hypothetical protein
MGPESSASKQILPCGEATDPCDYCSLPVVDVQKGGGGVEHAMRRPWPTCHRGGVVLLLLQCWHSLINRVPGLAAGRDTTWNCRLLAVGCWLYIVGCRRQANRDWEYMTASCMVHTLPPFLDCPFVPLNHLVPDCRYWTRYRGGETVHHFQLFFPVQFCRIIR